jgi:hypothetical protein
LASLLLSSKNNLVSYFLPLHFDPFIQIFFFFFIFLIFLCFDFFFKRQHQRRLDEKKINDFENGALKAEHVEKKFKI